MKKSSPKYKKCDCVLCSFENPKITATAVIIKNGKLLVVKRAEEPFKNMLDLPGGYVQKGETPEECLRRELKEELGVESSVIYIGAFAGTAAFLDFRYPVLNIAYFAELASEPAVKDKKEISGLRFLEIGKIKSIAFDSNEKILRFLKSKLNFNFKDIKKLVLQLDRTAHVKEASLYKAALAGHVGIEKFKGRTIGMGWIFPRQTLLRRQAVIEDLVVDEKFRGMGYGEKIMQKLIKWARGNGIETIELTTNSKRRAANTLYQKMGFTRHDTNHYLLKF